VPLTAPRVIAMLGPPVVAGLGVLYLAGVILVALEVYGVREEPSFGLVAHPRPRRTA
jgi:hypothetical protein